MAVQSSHKISSEVSDELHYNTVGLRRLVVHTSYFGRLSRNIAIGSWCIMMVNLFGMTAKAVSVPGKDLKFETKYSAVGGLK